MPNDDREGEQIVRRKKANRPTKKKRTYSHLTIKLHTILYTLYSFLHFKQTLNAKSFQYDANTSKRQTHRSEYEKKETPTVRRESSGNERKDKHAKNLQQLLSRQ